MFKLSDFTLDEKLKMLIGKNGWEVETSGKAPKFEMHDGPNGCKCFENNNDWTSKIIPTHCYPALSVISNSWDEDAAFFDGEGIAMDCVDNHTEMLLAPGVNIKRSLACGRNFEYFSEDPYLAGKMAKKFIEGLQSKGVGACIKHYALNNSEYDRLNVSANADERTMHDIYLRNFKIALEAKPWAVMCSYNRINGVYASENKDLLDEKLRKEMNYDGVIMSDWGAVFNRAKSLKATLDLQMPYEEHAFSQLKKAYEAGFITDEEIDASCDRLLKMIEKAVAAKPLRTAPLTHDERYERCVSLAEGGMVLLKNDGILPLKPVKKLGVIGTFAKFPAYSGGGSANVFSKYPPKPLYDEIKKLYPETEVVFEGVFHDDGKREIINNLAKVNKAQRLAYSSDAVVMTVGTGEFEESEARDRYTIKLRPQFISVVNAVAKYNKNVILVVEASSAVDLTEVEDSVAAILFTGFAGDGMNEAIAKIISGKTNPSGKLTETFPYDIEDCYVTPDLENYYYDDYTDGVFVGYRHFDKYNLPVRYEFGFGLSYSEFEYSNLDIKKSGEDYVVSYDVKNVSKVDGKEVSQVYIKDVFSLLPRPEKELAAFSKDLIKAGETKRVSVKIEKSSLEYYLPPIKDYYLESGDFEVYVGGSSRNLPLKGKINVVMPPYTQFTPTNEIDDEMLL